MNQKGITPILILVGVLVLLVFGGGTYFLRMEHTQSKSASSPTINQIIPQPTSSVPNSTLITSDENNQTTTELLKDILKLADKNINWGEIEQDKDTHISPWCDICNGYSYKGVDMPGAKSIGKDFIQEEQLMELGWEKYLGIDGNAPGGMAWGYVKRFDQRFRFLSLSYQSYSFLKDKGAKNAEANKPTEYSIFLTNEFESSYLSDLIK